MTLSAMRGFRRGFVLAAAGIIWGAGPARAQDMDEPLPQAQHSRLPQGAVVQPLDGGPGAELRNNLTTLAANPRSLDALIGAGRAAIGLRDAESAAGFFTRAQEIAPNDPRVKAGMASANLLAERPEQALILFAEAVQRGAPEAEIAGDRGLAYDMVGDPRRAQQDYALALRRRNDPEIERRLALSLAISGQRDAALRVIDGQLRRQDRAAWRTQAFVLALTGDPAGADDTARRVMPAPNAQAMAPFFAQLAALSPAQKAAAVNFGRFPSGGARYASNAAVPADPGALALAQAGAQARPQLAEPVNNAPRRRPDLGERPVNSLIRTPREQLAPAVQPSRRTQVAEAQQRRFAPAPPPPAEEEADDRAERQEAPPQAQPYPVQRPREAPAFVPGGNFTLDTSREERIPQLPSQSATPGFGSVGQAQAPSVRRFESVTGPPVQPVRQAPDGRPAFSDIASTVRALPGEANDPAAAAQRPFAPAVPLTAAERQARDAAARDAEARYRAGATAPARTAEGGAGAGAGRYWVQIAHGAQRGALAGHYRDVHAQAPSLVESRTAWTVDDRSTNRLLLGPFDDERAQRDFIDQLDRLHIAAIPWTSAGQPVERLGAGSASVARAGDSQPERRPAAAARTTRQAETRGNAAGSRASARGGSSASRAAAAAEERTPARGRSGRGATASGRNDTSRTGTANASGRSGAGSTSRTGRAATASGRDSTSRTARDRAGTTDRDGASTRSGRTTGTAARNAPAGTATRRGATPAASSTSSSRSTQSRRAGADAPRTNSTRSTQERRPAANDTRNTRSRSGAEQRPAPSRRPSH